MPLFGRDKDETHPAGRDFSRGEDPEPEPEPEFADAELAQEALDFLDERDDERDDEDWLDTRQEAAAEDAQFWLEPEPEAGEAEAESAGVTAPMEDAEVRDDEGRVLFPSFGQTDTQTDVATPQAEEQATGLYGKFHVERVDGKDRPGGPREGARYFVLDYVNDPVARIALRAYVTELRKRGIEPDLATDLNREINATRKL